MNININYESPQDVKDTIDILKRAKDKIDALNRRVAEFEKWNKEMVEIQASGGKLDGYHEMGEKIASMEKTVDAYRNAFLALCDGLQIQSADKLIDKPPEVINIVGQEIAVAAKLGSPLYNVRRTIDKVGNKKKYIDESVPIGQVLLRLAKDEYPDQDWIITPTGYVWRGHNHNEPFELNDATIGPIWRREWGNIHSYLVSLYKGDASKANAEMTGITTSLEAIVRYIVHMKHPEGIEI